MADDFAEVIEELRRLLEKYRDKLAVTIDTPAEYTLYTKSPSPFPQHKGHGMFFASVRLGKAYVSFHLMPLYMCEALTAGISPSLKKRMQGKSCFNFKTSPSAELVAELEQLTAAAFKHWDEQKWL